MMNDSVVQQQTEFAAQFRISYTELHKLMAASSTEELNVYFELLKVKKHSSVFRASLDTQVRNWLAAEKPTALKPLTPRQIQYAMPKWPVSHHIPR